MIININRKSSIELLKLISIFLIVISHIVQTVTTKNSNIDNFININLVSTTNFQILFLALLRNAGMIGNCIFFVCSAYYLIDNDKVKIKKIVNILLTTIIINIIIMLIFLISGTDISIVEIIKSFFPTLFNLNWYITLYLIIYIFHPYLNKLINSLKKEELFGLSILLFIMYGFIGLIKGSFLFTSTIITFVMIYFIVGYMKKYLTDFEKNRKNNIILLIVNIFISILLFLVTNFLGLKIEILSNEILHWFKNNAFFNILIALSLFNLFNSFEFKNKTINYVSSLSLLIYIIHENYFIRMYFRPQIVMYIYNKFTYKYIILWILLLTFVFYLGSIIIAILYNLIFKKFIDYLSIKIETIFLKLNNSAKEKINKIK